MTQAAIAAELGLGQQTVSDILSLPENCTQVQKTGNQQVTAKTNKVHRNTQRKLDQLAKADPVLAAKAIAKEIPVDAAMKQAGLIKKPSLVDSAMKLIKKMSHEELIDLKALIEAFERSQL